MNDAECGETVCYMRQGIPAIQQANVLLRGH